MAEERGSERGSMLPSQSRGGARGGFSWLTVLGFGFLTFNFGMDDIYRSNGGMGEVAFVVFSYVNLLALLFCLRRFERAPPGSVTRLKLKVAVGALSTTLALLFSIKVAAAMPAVVKVLVCLMAVATVSGGLYAFFLHWKRKVSFYNLTSNDLTMAPTASDAIRKVAVWLLSTALTLFFSIKLAATMPAAVKVLVWLMAFATVAGGFYNFFLHWKRKGVCVLATLRSHLPETAGGGSSAHDPRDTAWSRARLIADSGATSHAVGDILLLEGFQPYRPPLQATLADGSHLRIFGIGRIQRGNFSIPNVALVEGVQDGLISTPQLDTHHGLISCFGNGICRIMEADGTEVGGAVLEQDGSYVLRFLEVQGTAQAV